MWDTTKWIVFSLPFDLLLLGGLAWLLLRNTFRTRLRLARQLQADADIPEWMIVFNWSRKILYGPTIVVSLLAAALMAVGEQWNWWFPYEQYIVGGVWLAVFFFNFIIDEYEITLKLLMIFVLLLLVGALWLMYLGWLGDFVSLFGGLKVSMSSMGYLVMGLVLLLAIAVSWVRGLFYYTAITPNYIEVQSGPTETSDQIGREEYSTRIDTSDFLERVLGFGRIVVTFHDRHRAPLVLLVSRIGKRARVLESIRGVIAVDRTKAPMAASQTEANGGEML